MSKQIREICEEVTGKNTGPGPADYNTIRQLSKDRPLTAMQTHSASTQHFNRAPKDTMKVDVYDRHYESSYKNQIGPGPAAYSRLERELSTDRFKQTAFSRSIRKLTQADSGPGPAAYDTIFTKDKFALKK